MINEVRLYYMNLLNNFIIKKIPKNEMSIIKIIDIGNFLIIKGSTSSPDPLDIFSIVNEFMETYNVPEEIKFNTVDLIEYSSDSFINFKDVPVLVSTRYS